MCSYDECCYCYRYWGDDRCSHIHKEGPKGVGCENRDTLGNHQPLLSHRLMLGRQNLRLDRPPIHHCLRRHHLLRRSNSHGFLPQLCVSHVRPFRRRNRHRLRPHDRPRLLRRGLPSLLSWLPHFLHRCNHFFFPEYNSIKL